MTRSIPSVTFAEGPSPAAEEFLSVARIFTQMTYDTPGWPLVNLIEGVVRTFVRYLSVDAAVLKVARQPVLYLANHQTAIESLVFSYLLLPVQGTPVVSLAKAEHRASWAGRFDDLMHQYPGCHTQPFGLYIDQRSPRALHRSLRDILTVPHQDRHSVLVHVEGARHTRARQPLRIVANALIDLALDHQIPIIPVRLAGGLPVAGPAYAYHDFPYRFSRQDYYVGPPLDATVLKTLSRSARRSVVLEQMMALGPPWADEVPNVPNPELKSQVAHWINPSGTDLPHAVLYACLDTLDPSTLTGEIQALKRIADEGCFTPAEDPRGRWTAQLAAEYLGFLGMWPPQC